ncbi:hypothetical protein BKA66DRAFT_564788 [Pyrenochaeta sp. MPI-SDFR-AT-0127]|nr:hypothetical protein BKA66DRAFT_564788 [Pyrenochaeta sp. MPI-SDFR-AT-0127]
MVHSRAQSLKLVSVLFLLFTTTLTQSNGTDRRFCRYVVGNFDSNASVNSTGSRPFQFSNEFSGDQDWYLSVTVNDTRDPILVSSMHEVQGYISVAETTQADICVYMFGGMNAPAGDEMDGCEGTISEECVNFLEREIRFPTPSVRDRNGERRCNPRPMDDEAKKICGDALFRGPLISNSFSQDMTNHSCTIPSPPGFDIPSNYRTHAGTGFGASPATSDEDHRNFTWYERHVQRPIPWVIAGSFNNNTFSETKVICVAPNVIVEGSRMPQESFPHSNASTRAGLPSTWYLILVWMGLLSTSLPF